MSNAPQNFAVTYVPTPRERLWRRLGFRFHFGEDPPDGDNMPGWMMTETRFRFGLLDRLRILASGRNSVRTVSCIDTPSPMVVKNRTDWRIYAPGEAPGEV